MGKQIGPKFAEVERKKLISQVEIEMLRNLKIIPVLIALLPMFGLLGTVTGMIQVFDVMAYLGSGNPRAMADGVSAATIPTMSGMVIALIAIPFATQLDRRYKKEFVKPQTKTPAETHHGRCREAVTFLCSVRDKVEDPRRLLLGL